MTAALENLTKAERRGKFKTARIPIKVIPMEGKAPRKPGWIRAKAPTDPRVFELKRLLRERSLHTVCEEASCPNLGECFRARHCHLHDHGRHLHPALPVL